MVKINVRFMYEMDDENPSIYILKKNNPKELKRLLESNCDPNTPVCINREDIVYLLHSYQMIQLLLEYKADPNKSDSPRWDTIAMNCVEHQHLKTLELLIQYKADINLQDVRDRTCLDIAIGCKWTKGSLFLIRRGGKQNGIYWCEEWLNRLCKKYSRTILWEVKTWTNLYPVLAQIVLEFLGPDVSDWAIVK